MTTKRTVRLASLTIPGVFVLAMASRALVGFAAARGRLTRLQSLSLMESGV